MSNELSVVYLKSLSLPLLLYLNSLFILLINQQPLKCDNLEASRFWDKLMKIRNIGSYIHLNSDIGSPNDLVSVGV